MKTLIHPTAVIHTNAELHPTVQVGAYAVIGENVRVGADTVIGPHVVLEGLCEIGTGNQIFPGAAIGMQPQDLKYVGEPTGVKIGNNNYVHVGHNCLIENSVIIANSVALAGHVHIESRARLSGVLGVHQFVHIGGMSMIGGMARIDRDVPPYMLVEGNPARVRSLNLVGLKRSGMLKSDFQLIKKAFRLLYRSEFLFKDALEELENLGDTEELKHLRRFLLLSQMPGRRGLIPGKGKKTVIDE